MSDDKKTQQSGAESLADKVAYLEEGFKTSNKNMTDSLRAIIDILEEMVATQCDLPPFCEPQ